MSLRRSNRSKRSAPEDEQTKIDQNEGLNEDQTHVEDDNQDVVDNVDGDTPITHKNKKSKKIQQNHGHLQKEDDKDKEEEDKDKEKEDANEDAINNTKEDKNNKNEEEEKKDKLNKDKQNKDLPPTDDIPTSSLPHTETSVNKPSSSPSSSPAPAAAAAPTPTPTIPDSELVTLLQARYDARASRDYALSDSLRDTLKSKGVHVADKEKTWRMGDRRGCTEPPDFFKQPPQQQQFGGGFKNGGITDEELVRKKRQGECNGKC
jgi:hypothetical protein